MTLPLPFNRIVQQDQAGRDRINPDGVQQNFDALAQAFPLDGSLIGNGVLRLLSGTTRRSVAWGSDSLTFTASASSVGTVVTHGLGATPVVALAVGTEPGNGRTVVVTVSNFTSTTFDVAGFNTTGLAITASTGFYWLAIG